VNIFILQLVLISVQDSRNKIQAYWTIIIPYLSAGKHFTMS